MTILHILRNTFLTIIFILLSGCALKDNDQHEVYSDSRFEIFSFIDPDCIKQGKFPKECYRYREKRM